VPDAPLCAARCELYPSVFSAVRSAAAGETALVDIGFTSREELSLTFTHEFLSVFCRFFKEPSPRSSTGPVKMKN
jgi:hypothetical protein